VRIAVLTGLFPVMWETPFLNQITGLIEQGHEVDIYADQAQPGVPAHPDIDRLGLLKRTYYPPAQFRQDGRWRQAVKLIRSHRGRDRHILLRTLNPLVFWHRAFSLDQLRRTAPFLPVRSYDICYCPFGQDARKALRLRRLGALTGKLVVAFRGSDLCRYVSQRGSRAYRKVFRAGDLFLPVCDAFARRMIQLGCPNSRLKVHHTGINLRRFPYRPRRARSGQPLRLVSIGRLVEKKGIEYAINAVAQLSREGVDVTYEVVGDGPLKPDLQRRVAQMELASRVRLVGWRTHAQVREALDSADILLAPCVRACDGDEEGIPNVLREGMAVGVPVISTFHSGIPELVTDGLNGYLVPERDSVALSDRIRHLARNPDLWLPLTTEARRTVAEDDIQALNDRFVALLHGVIRPTVAAAASRSSSFLFAR
jgi:colanic acid/amylovoran biosynthesis glycosyltransferase